jgi:hypothetical protein
MMMIWQLLLFIYALSTILVHAKLKKSFVVSELGWYDNIASSHFQTWARFMENKTKQVILQE